LGQITVVSGATVRHGKFSESAMCCGALQNPYGEWYLARTGADALTHF